MATRIARGSGLHQDGDGRAFSAFEAEMRRRLWWQILTLDLRICLDRGVESMFVEGSYNTMIPCNINDEDFSYDSQHPLPTRAGPTEMTLSLLSMDALCTNRKIQSGPSDGEHENLTLSQKEDLIRCYTERVKSIYLADADFSDQKSTLPRLMAHYWMCKMRLVLYYPLQHRVPSHRLQSRTHGLQTALTFLDVNEYIEQDPSSAAFSWLFKSYVPWHAVAVILAELCHQPHGALADRAWEMVQSRVADWDSRAGDAKEAMIWASTKRLRKRAGEARQRSQSLISASQTLQSPDLQSPDLDALLASSGPPGLFNPESGHGVTNNGLDLQPLDNFCSLGDFDGQPWRLSPTNLMSVAADDPAASNISASLEDWNDFTFDVRTSGTDFFQEPYMM